MRTARRARPEVVTLEGRTLMSAAPLHHRVEAAHVSHVRVHKHPMVLNGNTLNVVIANKNGIAQVTGSSGRMSGSWGKSPSRAAKSTAPPSAHCWSSRGCSTPTR